MDTTITEAFLQHGEAGGPYRTESVEFKETEQPHFHSATGYGSRIPTRYMIRQEGGRWRLQPTTQHHKPTEIHPMNTTTTAVADAHELNYCKLIAMTYQTELRGAMMAQRMGEEDSYHRLTDYVMEQTQCELWELVEALDIVNHAEFEGENPFTARLTIAESMANLDKEEKEKAEARHRVYERTDWRKVARDAYYEGRIMARQEAREVYL